ncbi:Maf-like protein [Faunimonas sp. B44]|uniref:Maf-like protein n=1 Tax=Faunimonas sp. B44 TaxID=3461493 RepID=UPI0040450422
MSEASGGASRPLVLASGSPRRLALLEQIGIAPERLLPAEIDERPQRRELPRSLARRLAITKAEVSARAVRRDPQFAEAFVLAADTVVAVGRRILPKPELSDEAVDCLHLLSGRGHRVYTAVALVTPKDKVRLKLVETRVRFKRLSGAEIDAYVSSGEWQGKAGGYAVQGRAGVFVTKLVGSYSGVVGLPLYETASLLSGEGYVIHAGWHAETA